MATAIPVPEKSAVLCPKAHEGATLISILSEPQPVAGKTALQAAPTAKHIVFIDNLRAIAAMTVLLQHIADRMIFAKVAGVDIWHGIFVSLFDAGRFGVGVFFIVSGYVVPFSIREPNAVKTFLVGRFFRLYPVYWLSLLGGLAVITLYKGVSIPASHILANATMLEMAMGIPVLLGPYWTLIIELTFYAACVGLYMSGLLRSSRAAWAALAACLLLSLTLAVVGYITEKYLRANLLFNISLMFFGLAIRHADERPDGKGEKNVWLGGLLLAASATVVLFTAPDRNNPMFTPQSFLFGYLAAIAMFLFVRARRPTPSAMLVWLAAISYPVYLFHEIFLILLEDRLGHGAGVGMQIVFMASVAALTLLSAHLAHRWLERPAMELGRRITRRMRGTRKPAPISNAI